jgi:hypothetical protein
VLQRTSSIIQPVYVALIEAPGRLIMSATFFYSETYRESARRQFRVSVALVVLMAIGAFVAGFATPISSAQDEENLDDSSVLIGRLVVPD